MWATKRAGFYDCVASFPGLPRFYLPFAFTIIHGGGTPGRPGSIDHVSGREVGRRGGGADIQIYMIVARASTVWATKIL